jgi:hypothetical protein
MVSAYIAAHYVSSRSIYLVHLVGPHVIHRGQKHQKIVSRPGAACRSACTPRSRPASSRSGTPVARGRHHRPRGAAHPISRAQTCLGVPGAPFAEPAPVLASAHRVRPPMSPWTGQRFPPHHSRPALLQPHLLHPTRTHAAHGVTMGDHVCICHANDGAHSGEC